MQSKNKYTVLRNFSPQGLDAVEPGCLHEESNNSVCLLTFIMLSEREYTIRSLKRYWVNTSEPIRSLPIPKIERPLRENLPPKMKEITLPQWAECYGVNGAILVPCWAAGSESTDNWQKTDWFNVVFWYMQGLAERSHENISGPIHSYGKLLKGWDKRIWQYSWVNRIALFLRRWAAMENGIDEVELLGLLPEAQLTITHDVDAVSKTLIIRLKQTVFNVFNTCKLLMHGEWEMGWQRLQKSLRFLFSNDNYWCFSDITKLEEKFGIRSHFNFFVKESQGFQRSLKEIIFDPGYDVQSSQLKAQIRDLHTGGWTVGLHPSYLHWDNAEYLKRTRATLESVLGKSVKVCRQHWLRFSWQRTWQAQQDAGFTLDTTLGFNDFAGFRNGAALGFHPWDFSNKCPMLIESLPMVLMDSHLYDHGTNSPSELNDEIDRLLNEVMFVKGQGTIIWHQRVFSVDYGWRREFEKIIQNI